MPVFCGQQPPQKTEELKYYVSVSFRENLQVQLLILSVGPLMCLIRTARPAGLRAPAQWKRHELGGTRMVHPHSSQGRLGISQMAQSLDLGEDC